MNKEKFYEDLIEILHENNKALWEIHDSLCEFHINGVDVNNSGSIHVDSLP